MRGAPKAHQCTAHIQAVLMQPLPPTLSPLQSARVAPAPPTPTREDGQPVEDAAGGASAQHSMRGQVLDLAAIVRRRPVLQHLLFRSGQAEAGQGLAHRCAGQWHLVNAAGRETQHGVPVNCQHHPSLRSATPTHLKGAEVDCVGGRVTQQRGGQALQTVGDAGCDVSF